MDVSVVVPIYNEIENIPLLHEQVSKVLDDFGRESEMVFVDDGSTDGSVAALKELASQDARVKVVELRRNFGQTAAMQAGLQYASGEAIVTMDGDLQNEPSDIPMMVEKLDEGYDLVHGWRKNRKDAWVNRKLPSKIANWIISKTTGFPIHDLGCTMKAIRKEIAHELELYGEMHRFIPILAHQRGAKCVEVVANHHPRRFGTTKYGIGRTTRVILDLITVKYMLDYFASPMKLFGRFGMWCAAGGVASGAATVLMKLIGNVDMTGNPLLMLTIFCFIACLQFLTLGLMGEVNARIYFGSQQKQHYAVRNLINFDQPDQDRPKIRHAA